jgi:hypothetical protein
MRVRVVHARAVPAASAMMAQAVRTMTAPADLATQGLAARLMMDRLARHIQDLVVLAMEVRVALVVLVRAERGKTVRRYVDNMSRRWFQPGVQKQHLSGGRTNAQKLIKEALTPA